MVGPFFPGRACVQGGGESWCLQQFGSGKPGCYCSGLKDLQSEAGVSRETTFSPSWPHAHLLCARHRARHQSPKQCCLGPHCRTCSLVSVTGRSVLVTTHADFDNHDNVTHASSSPGQTRRPLISEDLTIGRQVSQVVGALNSHALPKLHARPTALQ